MDYILCSNCFSDFGLKTGAFKFGNKCDHICPNCGSKKGAKLNKDKLYELTHEFFVRGTLSKRDYGAAPVVQFNESNSGDDLDVRPCLKKDIDLIQKKSKVRLFYYGPRLWMIGEVDPLRDLLDTSKREKVITRILNEFPDRTLTADESFYRVRVNPSNAKDDRSYDSPPSDKSVQNRLNSSGTPVMYASKDIEVCIHECRVSVEDEIFVATLQPKSELRLLDLTAILNEKGNEFVSLDMAVHMLFCAGSHSYEITQAISNAAKSMGYDGILYPSYFSHLRTGTTPFETVYGISIRRIPEYQEHVKSVTVPNIALFGNPIKDGLLEVRCINRLMLGSVSYNFHFGPVI